MQELANLQLGLSYAQPGGELLPYKDVWVVCLREHPLQLIQLVGTVGRPAPLWPADRILQLVVITVIVLFSFLTVTIGGPLRGRVIRRLKKSSFPVVVAVLIST